MSDPTEAELEGAVAYYKRLWEHANSLRLQAESEWNDEAEKALDMEGLFHEMRQRAETAEAKIEELRGALREVYFHLGPPQPPGHEVGEEGVPALVQKAMADRDLMHEALTLIAEDDELAEQNSGFGLHAYRHRRDQARYVINRIGQPERTT